MLPLLIYLSSGRNLKTRVVKSKALLLRDETKELKHQKLTESYQCKRLILASDYLTNVEVDESSILPDCTGLKGPFSCLNLARYGICWGVLGAAEDCWFRSYEYGIQRASVFAPTCSNSTLSEKTCRYANRNNFC